MQIAHKKNCALHSECAVACICSFVAVARVPHIGYDYHCCLAFAMCVVTLPKTLCLRVAYRAKRLGRVSSLR